LTICASLNFQFLETFDILKWEIFQKIKIQSFKFVKTVVFDIKKSAKIDFT